MVRLVRVGATHSARTWCWSLLPIDACINVHRDKFGDVLCYWAEDHPICNEAVHQFNTPRGPPRALLCCWRGIKGRRKRRRYLE